MTKKQKQKWIKVLRSGKYKQGSNHLKLNNRYCCLGVAREIGVCYRYNLEEFVNISFLPIKIQKALANLNDNGVPFEVIAGFIDFAVEPTEGVG